MEILVDNRVGSKELMKPLQKLCLQSNSVTHLTHLDFGDFSFVGNGPDGRPVAVGVELKTITDLMSSMESRRLQDHQLPGLLNHYEVIYLIVEGDWRCGDDGTVEIVRHGMWGGPPSRRGWRYDAVCNFLTSLEASAGLKIRRCQRRNETVSEIHALAQWWRKDWDSHNSASVWSGVDTFGSAMSLQPPSLAYQLIAKLPGIGRERLREVAKRFGSVRAVANAKSEDWLKIHGVGRTGKPWRMTKAAWARVDAALDGF